MWSRYHHLFDGQSTGALFELEQHDMRRIGHEGGMRAEEGLGKRVSHGAGEEHETHTNKQ